MPRWGADGIDLPTGGSGWDAAAAEAAGVGEAVERWLPSPLPQDEIVEASLDDWKRDEPALGPEQWVLFHAEQYSQPDFPFVPWTEAATRRWVCCREVGSGLPAWVPEEYVFLAARPGVSHRYGPALSTGLACGRKRDPVLLRGLQEVIERDALVGAWWGRYALDEHDPDRVFGLLGTSTADRLRRPNLTYRFFRVATPHSSHVTVVTLAGEDHEGFCFSVGSACRETRAAGWNKAVLEAVQGRHYVRFLKAQRAEPVAVPTDFPSHAVYYSYHPERLGDTAFADARRAPPATDDSVTEGVPELRQRLGEGRPVYYRHMTPPPLLGERLDFLVLRVIVPGLQPLHGHHLLPYLGGPLWAPRSVCDYESMPPHPFP
jgi:thiazole/oxazole-forming peptide maturase SagD family component